MYKKAKAIVEKLHSLGYVAYFAGGWVRDYLLGNKSSDIDIATNASPTIIQQTFPHTIPIGEAFGIILIIDGEHQFEIATFRRDLKYEDGRRPSEIEFTTAVEDAKRRDFTINGMFFDPLSEKVIDYVDGQKDLQNKIIRAIGDADKRFVEDRLRMIRAIRFSAKFDFEIEENTKNAILNKKNELFPHVSIERIYQELEKMVKYKNFFEALIKLFSFGLLQEIFPSLKKENISLDILKNRLLYLDSMPENTPVIIKLFEIFDKNLPLEEKLNLATYFKLSKKDFKFIEKHSEIKDILFNKEKYDDYTFVNIFAHPDFDLIMKIIAAHNNKKERENFLNYFENKKRILLPFINKKKKGSSIITSKDLIEHGIPPGPKMGMLLKEAEKFSINNKIEDKSIILKNILKNENK